MQFNYADLEEKLGMQNYNPDLRSELIGIAQEYDRIVTENNDKIFTGVLTHNNRTIKYPKSIKERLKAQRFATAAKSKLIENFRDLYSQKQIISAIKGFKP